MLFILVSVHRFMIITVKMCIQNSCYIIFVELLLNIFMLKFSNVPYNSVFITKLIMFVSVTIVIHTKRKNWKTQ